MGAPPSVSVTLVSSALLRMAGVVQVMAEPPPPAEVSRSPDDPTVTGRLKLYDPAAACPAITIVPLVEPVSFNCPVVEPATPIFRRGRDPCQISTSPERSAVIVLNLRVGPSGRSGPAAARAAIVNDVAVRIELRTVATDKRAGRSSERSRAAS